MTSVFDQGLTNIQLPQHRWEGVDHVQNRWNEGEQQAQAVDNRRVGKQRRQHPQYDENDRQWVQEHQNRCRPGDNLVQSQVGNDEG